MIDIHVYFELFMLIPYRYDNIIDVDLLHCVCIRAFLYVL